MKKFLKLALAIGLLSLTCSSSILTLEHGTLTTAMSFKSLNENIVDPRAIEFVTQYNLIENLAVGLIRDDVAEPSGYRPALASQWQQVTDKKWIFELQPNNRWSDGSPLTPQEIKETLLRLKTCTSVHIHNLKLLEDVEIGVSPNSQTPTLMLTFSAPTNESLLNELSLADSTIYKIRPADNKPDWSVTSGPYLVEQFDLKSKTFVLAKNTFSPLADEESPQKIRILTSENLSHDFLNSAQPGLTAVSAFAYQKKFSDLKTNPDYLQTFGSHANVNFFKMTNVDARTRKHFAQVTRAYFKNAGQFLEANNLKFEDQLFPQGYQGRDLKTSTHELSEQSVHSAQESQTAPAKVSQTPLPKIQVQLMPQLQDLKPEFEKFQAFAKNRGLDLAIEFTAQKTDQPAAVLNNFKGNQKDPLGTWTFQFSKFGALNDQTSNPKIKQLLKVVTESKDTRARQTASQQMQEVVLSEAIIVPFMTDAPVVFHRKNIDISRWNPFDMRLRLYDVRVK